MKTVVLSSQLHNYFVDFVFELCDKYFIWVGKIVLDANDVYSPITGCNADLYNVVCKYCDMYVDVQW